MNKSKFRWFVIWNLYRIPAFIIIIPMMVFFYYSLQLFYWLAKKTETGKLYLIRKYKP